MSKMKRFVALLLALIMTVQLVPLDGIQVSAEGAQQQSVGAAVNIAAKHTNDAAADITWNYTTAFTGTGTTAGKLDARWNATTLLIGLEYTDATSISVTLGSITKTKDLPEGRTNTVLEFSLKDEFGVTLLDYGQSADFSATLTGSSTATISDAKLQFVVASETVLANIPANSLSKNGMTVSTVDGQVVYVMDDANGNESWLFTTSGAAVATLMGGNSADRSTAMLAEQTICIEKLPVSTAGTVANPGKIPGLYIYLCDGTSGQTDDVVILSFHADAQGNLTGFVSNKQEIDLGKKLGDTFKLGLQWDLDNTATVFVDHVPVASVENALDPTANGYVCDNAYGAWYTTALPGQVKFTVTNPVIMEAVPASIRDSVDSDDLKAAIVAANPGVDLNVVKEDLVLPATVSDPYLGTVPITWESSDAAIGADGTVTRPANVNKAVTLTAKAGTTSLGAVEVTVWREGVVLQDIDVIAKYTASGSIAWTYPVAFLTNESTPSGGLNTYWDKENLYVGVSYADAEKLDLTVNGKSLSYDLAGTGEKEIVIGWDEVDVTLADYNQVVTLQAVLSDAAGNTAKIADTAANVHLVVTGSTDMHWAVTGNMNSNGAWNMVADGYKIYFDNETTIDSAITVTDASQTAPIARAQTLSGTQWNPVKLSHDQDWYLEQTMKFDALPEKAAADHGVFIGGQLYAQGFSFLLSNRNDSVARGEEASMLASIQNVGGGKLALFIANANRTSGYGSQAIDLGVNVGETFKLGTQWNADGSADIYVNDRYITSVEDATRKLSYVVGNGNYYLVSYSHLAGDARFTITDVNVFNSIPASLADEMDLDTMLGDLSNVTENITLPAEFDSAYLGKLPLTWESSNPAVIANDGTVTRPAGANARVELTAKIGDTVLGKVIANVKRISTPVDEYVAVFYAANESAVIGWNYDLEFLSEESAATGKLGAYWNKDSLIVGVEYQNAAKLTLELGTYNKTFDLDGSKTSAVFTVPMAETGISITDYNQVLKLQAVLTDAAGKESKIAASYDRLCLSIPNNADAPLATLDSSAFPSAAYTNGFVTSGSNIKLSGTVTAEGVYTGPVTPDVGQVTDAFYAFYKGSNKAEIIDHSRYDLLWQQTITVNTLPQSTPVGAVSHTEVEGFSFYMNDRYDLYDHVVMATVYNTGAGLALFVHNVNKTVNLGVNVGEAFTLGVQWNKDDTLDVYLNGRLVTTFADVTLTQINGQFSGDTAAYVYNKLVGTVDIDITDSTISEGIPTTLVEEMTQQALLGDQDLSAVRDDLSLPAVYTSPYFGDLAVTWTSSNTAVIAANGKVTRPESGDVTVQLSPAYNAATLFTVNVTVKKAVPAQSDLVPAMFTADPGAIVWEYTNGIKGAAGPAGGVAAYWNSENLYIGLEYGDATAITVKAAGKTYSFTPDSSAITGVFTIPMSDLEDVLEYHGTVDFVVTLTNAAGANSSAAEGKGKLRFCMTPVEVLQQFNESWINTGSTWHVDHSADGVFVMDTETTIDAATTIDLSRTEDYALICGRSNSGVVDHYTRDLLAQQTIRIDAMPEAVYAYDGTYSTGGLLIDLIDRVQGNGNNCQTLTTAIVNEGGSLVLYAGKNPEKLDLGVKLGEAFKLGVQWNMDDSAYIFVNDLLVGIREDATDALSWNGNDALDYRYNGLSDAVKVVITDAALWNGMPTSRKAELSKLALLGGQDLTNVRQDISLPAVYTSPYTGDQALTWTSSDPARIAPNGKVDRLYGQNADVTLSVAWKGETLWSVDAVVIRKAAVQANLVKAFHTADASAITWEYTNGIIGTEQQPAGSVEAYWDKDNLYVGVEYMNADTLNIYVNGKQFTYPLDAAQYSTVQTIAWADVTPKVEIAYNGSIPFYVTLTNANGTSASATKEAGKLTFLIPVDTSFNVGLKANIVTNMDIDPVTGVIVMDTATNTNGDTTVTDTAEPVYLSTVQHLELLDHDVYDMMLQQTLCVEEMPQTVPAFTQEQGTVSSNGLVFYFGDRGAGGYTDARLFLASLNNTAEGLVLYVAEGGTGENGTKGTTVKLNKKLGETFTLGTQWNTDDTVDIYIDGIYVQTIENVTRNYTDGQTNFTVHYNYADTAESVRVVISEAVAAKGIPLSKLDELNNGNLLGTDAMDQVRSDFTLPTAYESPYMGVYTPIVWTSSNTGVLKIVTDPQTGEAVAQVIRPVGDQVTAVLTGTYGGTTVAQIPVTVLGKASQTGAVVNAWHNEGILPQGAENFSVGLADASGKIVGAVDASWDKTGLYVYLDLYESFSAGKIKANGTSHALDMTQGEAGYLWTFIGLADLKIENFDYNTAIDFQVEVTGADGQSVSTLDTKLYFRIPTPTDAVYAFPQYINNYEGGVYNVDYTTTEGVYVFDNEKKLDAFTSVKTSSVGKMYLGGKRHSGVVDHYADDLLLEQTIRIDAMPSAAYKYNKDSSNGLTIYMIDRVNNNINNCLTMYASIVNNNGKLVLHLANTGKSVDLGKGLGETFKLGLQWNMNDSVDVYIDGIYNTTVADVTVVEYGNGNDNVTYAYNNLSDEVKITLTDVGIYSGIPASIRGELIQPKVLSGVELDGIINDISLPTSYESPYIGTVTGITWKSENAAVITDGGKVTRPDGVDTQVGLTASYRGSVLWTATATVLCKSAVRNEIAAVNTSAANADEIVWAYTNGFAGGNGAPTGDIGAYWNGENLFVGVAYKDATKLTVYASDKAYEVELPAGENAATVTIPLAQIIKPEALDYNVSIPFYAVLSNGAASSATATKDNGKLYFSLPVQGSFNAGQKVNTGATTNFSVDPLTGVIVFDNTTNANGATTITNKGNENVFSSAWDRTLLDHDVNNIMLQQTIYIQALPTSNPTFINETGTTETKGLSFYFGDRGAGDWSDIRIALFSIHNTSKGLALYVADGSDGADYSDGTVIYLNRKVGETFTLGTQWNKDDSVDVYLDGVYLKTVKDVTRAYQNSQVNFNLYYKYANLSGDARITILKATFSEGIPKSLAEEMSPESLFAGVNLDAVRGDLPMGPVYESPYMGAIETLWTSSDPSVIDPATGKVTRSFEKDIKVTLTLTVRGAKLWTRTVIVKKAHEAQKNELVAMHSMKKVTTDAGFLSGTEWNYTNGIVGTDNIVYGNIAAKWDKDNIYLGMEHVGAKKATFVVNGKTVEVDLETNTSNTEGVIVAARDGLAEIVIPMSAINLKLLDYERTVKFRVTLSDGTNSAFSSSAEGKGYIRFTIPESVAMYLDMGQEKPDLETPEGSATFDVVHAPTGVTVGGGKTVFDLDDNDVHNISTKYLGAIDHNRNQRLDQTLCFSELPVTEARWYGVNESNGYYFYVVDKAVNPNKAASASYGRMVYSAIHNVGDGKLVMAVNAGTAESLQVVDLGVKVGQTFKLSTLWEADDSFAVYVNGKKLAEFENMTYSILGFGQDLIMMGYQDGALGKANFTVSDVSITNTPYTSIDQEINAISVFADDVPSILEDDIDLPKVYNSIFLGEIPLSWKTSNADYLTATGKVTRPFGVINGVNVDLTMSIVGLKEMFTVSPLIKSAAVTSLPLIQAPFSEEEIVLDGSISEKGWSMNTNTRTEGGKQTANIGVQWDLENLYMAIKTEQISKMKLTLGEQEISLGKAGVKYVTKDDVTELSIPLSNLGIVVQDYGDEIPMAMTVGDGVYEGVIELSSIDWFATDNEAHRVKCIQDYSDDSEYLGIQTVTNGFYLFDHYNAVAPELNKGDTRANAYIAFPKAIPGIKTVDPLWPVDETYYMSFDFQAESMPVYNAAAAAPDIRQAAEGMTFYVSGHRDGIASDYPSECVLCGIYNAGDEGLMFVISGEVAMKIVPLNRHIGDLFRIGVACDQDGDVTIFLDGEEIAYLEDTEKNLSGMCSFNEDGCVSFMLNRNKDAAKSDADNFDVYITNFAFGLYYGDELLDSLTFDKFGGLNSNEYWTEEEELAGVTRDIKILPEFSNNQLTTPVKLTWESSNDDIVNSATGKVTRPEASGQLVTLTCTTELGKSKSFDMYVKGLNPDDQYMWVYRDIGAYKNPGEVVDVYTFTLDEDNNSIIYNQKESKPFNVVRLTDGDEEARLHTDFLELFVSDDNVTYTPIEDFKLLQVGQYWYFYGFEAQGQYVKVHCTHFNPADADMEGLLQGFITAYHEEEFGQGEGTFANTTEYTVTNDTGKDAQDEAWKIPVSELGDVFATETYADIRVYLGETILYHYYEDGNIVVRIPELAKGDSVKLTIKSGNASAMDISNKEYVHEIIYGTRETWNPPVYFQNRMARFFTFEDGTVIGMDVRSDGNGFAKQYSYDGGQSWTKASIVPETTNLLTNISGYFYDDFYDRLFVCGHNEDNGYDTHVLYTEDQGETWTHMTNADGTCGCPNYVGSNYVNGLTLCTNDGEGPGVDFMMGLCNYIFNENGARVGLKLVPCYSKDGGRTWEPSEELFVKTPQSVRNGGIVENGLSENAYIETEDGTIVMYVRWQAYDKVHFAVYYSYDHGITWTDTPALSEVYTVNTNPVFFDWNDTPLLVWSGNAAFGGQSYRRMPVSIATFAKDDNVLMSPLVVQDIYNRYSLQGMDTATQQQATNPSMNIVGDTALIEWFNNFSAVLLTTVEDFSDFMYKTKGAYDSFEGRNMKYEGWAQAYGLFEVSDEVASHGKRSLFINANSVAGRSIGYMEQGSVSMDVYCEDDKGGLQLELQTGYSNDEICRTSPVKIIFEDGKLVAGDTTLVLNQGWNSLKVDVDVSEEIVNLTVNGVTADITDVLYGIRTEMTQDPETFVEVYTDYEDYAFDASIGKYISWVRFEPKSAGMYLDNFLVIDNDDVAALESNGGIGGDGEGFDIVANLWWIIVVICVIAAIVVFIVLKGKKKGTAEAAEAAAEAAAEVAEIAAEALDAPEAPAEEDPNA